MLDRLRRFGLHVGYRILRISWRIRHPVTLGVRLLLVDDDKILLVQHTYRPGWFLPGGRPEKGESLAKTARREAQEEAGVEAKCVELLGMVSHLPSWRSDHVAVFTAKSFTRKPISSGEIERVGMFSLDGLPDETSDEARAILEKLHSAERRYCIV
ncbi:NUDIX domain-containing protein [Salinibacter ruber]|uniref:NUDIX domain-containing protein n=1 Tax=Salinibacter ruber TaxID=146919 RepID=UPI002342F9D8